MVPTAKAHSVFAVIFLAVVFCGGALNLTTQGRRIIAGLDRYRDDVLPGRAGRLFRRAETLAREHFLGKYAGWAAYARIQQALGKTAMNNFTVIRAPDGRLYRGGLSRPDNESIRMLAEDVGKIATEAAGRGAHFLYLAAPDAVAKDASRLPVGVPLIDFNASIDTFLYGLRQEGVPFLDARYQFMARRFPPEAVTPRTGPLLTAGAAFALFGVLLDGLERKFSLQLDPNGFYRDRDNYAAETYPDFFMGQFGKETGPAFGGVDDFTTLSPAFETEFAIEGVTMFDTVIDAEGPASETLFNPEALVYYDSLYNLYPEGYYAHTNTAWSRVINMRNPGGIKMLFVHDFYAAQLVSMLAPLCGEIHTLAYQDNYRRSVAESLLDTDFDVVIVSFFPEYLSRPQTRALLAAEDLPDAGDGGEQ